MKGVVLLAVLLAVAVSAVELDATTPAPYPPVVNVAPFLGLHFFYYETTTDAVYEMYIKNNHTLDYHVWLGTVNGAQCAKDQKIDLVPIGDGMVRLAYEEPTGAINSHVLDTGVAGLFKMFYRVTMSPAWLLANQGEKALSGCSQYDAQCLSQILAWRTAGPTEPQVLVAGKPLPVLFIEKVAQNKERLIDCSVTIASPFISLVAREKTAALQAAADAHRAQLQTIQKPQPALPIAGFWYRYYYVSTSPGSEHQSFDLYIRNDSFIEMKLQMTTGVLCSRVPAVTDLMRLGIWRITWRGNKNKNFQSNLVKPMQGWDVGQAFTGLTAPTIDPTDPHAYGHLYSESIVWAVLTNEEYRGVNNNTAIGC